MKIRHWLSSLALAGLLGSTMLVQSAEPTTTKGTVSFGTLRALPAEAARTQAQDWLKSIGKMDEATQQAFEAIWKAEEQTVFDRCVETIQLGSPEAAKLLAEARNPEAPAPQAVPALLQDNKLNAFFRANLITVFFAHR